MKINYQSDDQPEHKNSSNQPAQKQNIENIRVGHTASEMYISFGGTTMIMPPGALKELLIELTSQVHAFENDFGKIKLKKKIDPKKRESTVAKVVKSLYKSRKLSPKFISVNTKRKKHLP